MRLRNTLYPDNEQVNDDECRDNDGQDEHMQEVHPRHGLIGQAGPAEHGARNPRSNQWCTIGHVDANRRRAECQTIPRQKIPGITEEDGEEHQTNSNEPIQFTWVAICTCEVDTTHV